MLYIHTEKSIWSAARVQMKHIEMMKADGANLEEEFLPSGHSPFLSMPEKLFITIYKHII